MNSHIDNLIKQIGTRHACKNVGKYAVDIEKAIGIKLVPADSNSLEFTWSKDFEWYSDAVVERNTILEHFKQQKPKMFSVKEYGVSGHYKLFFTFKFHPENAV